MPPAITTISAKYLMKVNCYLLHGDGGLILVDTGFSKRRAQVEAALEAAGVGDGALKLIVLTHGDADHVGNAAYLRERYGAPIAMHEADVAMVRAGDMSAGRGVNGLQRAMLRFTGRLMGCEVFEPDILLAPGSTLAEWGLAAEVLHLPGHSPGSIGLLLDDGVLIGGDLLSHMGKPKLHLPIDNAAAQASLQQLHDRAVQTVYPGHGAPFPLEAVEA